MQEIRNAFYRSERAYALDFVDFETGEREIHLTKQSDKDSTDINRIIGRYKTTGLVEHVAKGTAMYGDYTNVNEYQDSLNRVIAAQQSFAGLPAKIRDSFDNNPGLFFEFATNPANLDKLIEMGLANAAPSEPAPMRVEVVNQPAIPG